MKSVAACLMLIAIELVESKTKIANAPSAAETKKYINASLGARSPPLLLSSDTHLLAPSDTLRTLPSEISLSEENLVSRPSKVSAASTEHLKAELPDWYPTTRCTAGVEHERPSTPEPDAPDEPDEPDEQTATLADTTPPDADHGVTQAKSDEDSQPQEQPATQRPYKAPESIAPADHYLDDP